MSVLVGLSLSCVSAREKRLANLDSAARVLPRVPVGSNDWAEMSFMLAILETEEADDLARERKAEAADRYRVDASRRLDEVVERAPTFARLNEVHVYRAVAAMRRERFDEAVGAFRKALALGIVAKDEAYVRASFPRALRLSGDCAGVLEQPHMYGVVAANVRLQRAHCFPDDRKARCDELVAGLDEATDAGISRTFLREARGLAASLSDDCAAREPLLASVDAGAP